MLISRISIATQASGLSVEILKNVVLLLLRCQASGRSTTVTRPCGHMSICIAPSLHNAQLTTLLLLLLCFLHDSTDSKGVEGCVLTLCRRECGKKKGRAGTEVRGCEDARMRVACIAHGQGRPRGKSRRRQLSLRG